jgi:predicted transcriptional regulator
MKALLLSIRPEYAINILNGEKTLELRKSVPKGYKGWVYVYVTKGKPRLSVVHDDENGKTYYYLNSNWGRELNATIPFRFWFEEYISYKYYADDNTYFVKRPQDFGYGAEGALKSLCLTRDEFKEYGKGKGLYAWHIKKLDTFYEPMQLSDFYRGTFYDAPFKLSTLKKGEYINKVKWLEMSTLKHPPQSWRYVYVKEVKE